MARAWITIAVVLVVVGIFAGLLVTYYDRERARAELKMCQDNFRQIALFAGRFADPKKDDARLTNEVPAGTIFNAALPPGERLSWFVTALPWLDQRRVPVEDILRKLDRSAAWNAGANEDVAKTKIVVLLCPGMPPVVDPQKPAPTNYFGSAGIGVDAAILPLKPDGVGIVKPMIVSPTAGCFRFDSPTPFSDITDGLSETILICEREPDTGPWLRGGPSTVRGLDIAAGAPPLIGSDCQYGGGHPAGANFAFADGSARVFTPRTDRKVLEALMTIAGGKQEVRPGE